MGCDFVGTKLLESTALGLLLMFQGFAFMFQEVKNVTGNVAIQSGDLLWLFDSQLFMCCMIGSMKNSKEMG